MIPEMKLTYQEMPKSKEYPVGMKLIKGDKKNIRSFISQDVIYANKDNIDLKIRFIKPDSLDEKEVYPLYFHIQGSAWMKQNLNAHILDFKSIVQEGFIVAIVEYRPCDIALFPSQIEDAKCAMRYIYHHAKELQIDIDNIFISGDSSGGHTSTMCWATWNTQIFDYSQEILPKIKGFIDLYGVSNLATMHKYNSAFNHETNSPATMIINVDSIEKNKEKALKASPISYINEQSNNDPLLIIHGNKDRVVPFEQSVELYEKCVEYHKDVEFYCVDDADHGGSIFYCKDTLAVIIEYLKKNLSYYE